MQFFYVYILKCSDGLYYVGHTDNLEYRISEHHNAARECFTSRRLPVQLVYQQAFVARDEALLAERKIKKWTRSKKEALIAGNFLALQQLARSTKNTRT